MHDLVIRNGTIVDGTGAARFVGDIAVDGGHITSVGKVAGEAAQTIDATGRIVTPGFVDIHTHYDGQATWDTVLAPSAWHGVTTVVFGNCGVGFAPVAPNRHDQLVKIMEGVEDIPGTALHEGLTWEWQSFPEYLDKLASVQFLMDVGTQVPHNAVRAHVMGARGSEQPATPDDVKKMAAIVREGINAGALGFSTSRTGSHSDSEGKPVPSRYALEDELLEIGRVLGDLGTGLFEVGSTQPVPDDPTLPMKEAVWLRKFARQTGRPITFTVTQQFANPGHWKEILRISREAADAGEKLRPQSLGRPVGALMGLESRHPFANTPTWQAELDDLLLPEKVERMSDPDVRRRLIEEATSSPQARGGFNGLRNMNYAFPLGDGGNPNYEPNPEKSIAATAEREGRTEVDVCYDELLSNDGKQLILRTLSNFHAFNLDVVREMLTDEVCSLGLSDAGAHVRSICDGSQPTFMLTHWSRDRSRGPTLPLEFVVKKQTYDTANLYGLHDRGVLKPGYRADINVIDYDNLTLGMPHIVQDLPANGSRLMQYARGYDYTIVKGEVTLKDGQMTGARPGRLIRGEQHLTYIYRQAARQSKSIEV